MLLCRLPYPCRPGGPHNAVFVVWEMRSFSPVLRKSLRPTLNIPTPVEALARPLRRAPKSRAGRGTQAKTGLGLGTGGNSICETCKLDSLIWRFAWLLLGDSGGYCGLSCNRYQTGAIP